jgi:hypothetical protein
MRWNWLLVCLLLWNHSGSSPRLLAQEQESSSDLRFEASMDDVVDWEKPFDLQLTTFEKALTREGYSQSPLYVFLDKGKSRVRMGRKPFENVDVTLSALSDSVRVETAMIEFRNGRARHFLMDLAGEAETTADACQAALTSLLGLGGTVRSVASPTLGRVRFTTWESPEGVVVLTQGPDSPARLGLSVPEESHRLYVFNAGEEMVLSLPLDFLFDLPANWRMSQDQLDARLAVPGFSEQIYFQWMTADRSRARFASSPFSNVTLALSLFEGQLPIEELVVDFENEQVKQMTVSVYNRGDTGEMSAREFEGIYKTCGRALGQKLGVAPRRQPSNGAAAIKTVSWLWKSPHAVALMEHNEFGDGSSRQPQHPEFLRLKVAPPGNMDWNFGVTALGARTTTVNRSSLLANVTRGGSGDVFVKGIPMVDQGDKGYCVVASCQRLFEYFHIPCDQHEMALLVGADARRGTNSFAMEEALDKIDNRFKTRFKPLIHTQMSARDRKRLDASRFAKFVKDSVDEGIPLLWTLQLGRFPESPPLPGDGQTTGGHMRMIIGYNAGTNEVLFSDSWGAGHELKRMGLGNAFEATTGLYLMQPRTL